jgi:hypothetical protein
MAKKQISLISIAEDLIEQQAGLKYVKQLAAETGMLFKYQSPRILSFWMESTYIPLEIAFIDHQNTIVKTERMIPLSLRSVTSGRPCVMALEVPFGTFDADTVGKKVVIDVKNKRVEIE